MMPATSLDLRLESNFFFNRLFSGAVGNSTQLPHQTSNRDKRREPRPRSDQKTNLRPMRTPSVYNTNYHYYP